MMSTQLILHYFSHFQEMLENMSAQTQTWHSWPGNATKNVQKKVPEWGPEKVPESAGLVGDDLAVL